MKKTACAVLAAFLILSTLPGQIVFAQPAGPTLVGTVVDIQGNPVAGVKVAAKDTSGKVIGEAVTNNQGQYVIQNLPPGQYQLTLDPQLPYKGETVVASIPSEGLTVNWVVSPTDPAVATAIPGVVGAGQFGALLPFAAVVLTATIITAVNADNNNRQRVVSPPIVSPSN